MIVTHLLQVLGFVAMEPPTSFSAKALLDETAKVADSLQPIQTDDVVYGQYTGYPDEDGVAADSQTEIPGPAMQLGPARFTFDYKDSFTSAHQLKAYERLIHDALTGDRTLFTRADGIERLWEASAPLIANTPPVHEYSPGSWGPPEADALIAPRRWHLPQPELETEAT